MFCVISVAHFPWYWYYYFYYSYYYHYYCPYYYYYCFIWELSQITVPIEKCNLHPKMMRAPA